MGAKKTIPASLLPAAFSLPNQAESENAYIVGLSLKIANDFRRFPQAFPHVRPPTPPGFPSFFLTLLRCDVSLGS
jgi:hypothetical protein